MTSRTWLASCAFANSSSASSTPMSPNTLPELGVTEISCLFAMAHDPSSCAHREAAPWPSRHRSPAKHVSPGGAAQSEQRTDLFHHDGLLGGLQQAKMAHQARTVNGRELVQTQSRWD